MKLLSRGNRKADASMCIGSVYILFAISVVCTFSFPFHSDISNDVANSYHHGNKNGSTCFYGLLKEEHAKHAILWFFLWPNVLLWPKNRNIGAKYRFKSH